MNNWTRTEIEKIMIQLDERQLPFWGYELVRSETGLELVGQGGFALVYEARSRRSKRHRYVIKVIGFGNQYVNSDYFKSTAKVQMHLGIWGEDVVRVFDFAEYKIGLDEEDQVLDVWKLTENPEKDTEKIHVLHLQFVLMEKMQPVIVSDSYGDVSMEPKQLQEFDEKEVLHVAYDIGNAILRAHKKNILHRDIKLENTFYDSRRRRYKLGDFGIAKVTQSGMASTRTFTKGYGAPEVLGRLQDQYDGTADIYSFGIMLYLLLNDLRFPGSDTYHVNLSVQYSQDFCMPRPAHGSDALCAIIDRMCRFDPDERYQSMQDVMRDLNRLLYGDTIGYEKAHNMATGVLGACMCVLGAAARIVDVHSWVTFVFFSMAVILLYQFVVLADPYNVKYARLLFSGNRYWLFGCVFYLTMMLTGAALHLTDGHLLHLVMTDSMIAYLSQVDLTKAGGVGFLLCIVWMIRKQILIKGNIDALNYKR